MQRIVCTAAVICLGVPCTLSAQSAPGESGDAPAGTPRYELDVALDPSTGRVSVEGSIHVPRSLLPDGALVLLHNGDATNLEIRGRHLESLRSEMGDGVARHTIELGPEVPDTVRLDTSYSVTIPADHALNRVTADWVELNIDSFWHPVVASIPDIRYRVRVDLGADLDLVSGDRVTRVNDRVYRIENYIPRRDIPFAAGPALRVVRGEMSEAWTSLADVDLEGVVRTSDSILAFLRAYTARREDFEEPRRVVLTPREESGYSRKNYVAMSDVRDMDPMYLPNYLAHEFSHYWFSNAHFESRHHWLTESFAEYLSMIYMRTRFGDAWLAEDLALKRQRADTDPRTMAEFDARPPHVALYHRGPLLLHAFELEVGPDAFREMIRAFIREDVRTNGQLFDLVERELGTEARRTLQRLFASV